MNDIDIIKQIEGILNIKLETIDKIDNSNKGYFIDISGQVTVVCLCRCDIENIGIVISSLKELKNLTKLDLSYNRISDISPITELKNISSLWLNNNLISDISYLNELDYTSIWKKNLIVLGLGGNQISDISPLKELKSLTQLDLNINKINDIIFLKELENLTHLWVNNNQINDISPLQKLNDLKILGLSGNQISDIYPLKGMKILKQLNLARNQIKDLSPLKELKELTQLDLSKNPIETLEEWITEFNMEFQWINTYFQIHDHKTTFFDNPLKSPPVEIVKQGKEAVKNYFKQLEEQGKDYIYEAKLMIVGEPGAGKTTLLMKLFNRNYPVPEISQKSTLGIEVKPNWKFSIENNPYFKAHIWDFGGQQIQYMLHQFFLTSDCLYIIMAEKRKELSNFDYWLNIINILGKNSPVIVLFNEINIKSATSFIYDEKKYKELFPEMNLHKLDVNFANINDGRFDVLINSIKEKVSGLQHIGREVPARWIDIRKKLENRRAEKHIHINEYFKICSEFGLENEEDRLLILKYFHLLGIVLHFSDDINLKDVLFLDPNWTVDAVYCVLTDPEIEKNNGRFNGKKIDAIWTEKGYSFEERTKLLQLMLKDNFDLCYKIHESKDEYIVPLLLCKIKPAYEWEDNDNLQFRLQYPFIPKGIVSRLIVRLNKYIEDDKVWNEGAVFSKNGARAQVIEKTTTKEGLKIIEIRLKGLPDKRKDLLFLIREEIHKIQNNSFPSLPFSEMVPCNCVKCVISEDPEFYDSEILEDFLSENDNEIQCRKSRKMINIHNLVDSVYDLDKVKELFRRLFKDDITILSNQEYNLGINKLSSKMEEMLSCILEKIESENKNSTAKILTKLNETEMQMVELIYRGLEENKISESEMKDVLQDISKEINLVKDLEIKGIVDKVNSSKDNINNKFKLIIPIIPLFFQFEQEMPVNSPMKKLWEKWRRVLL